MFPCHDCGAEWTAPTETGRCIPCCVKSQKEWKERKAEASIVTEEEKAKKKYDKKVDKIRKRQMKMYGRELI